MGAQQLEVEAQMRELALKPQRCVKGQTSAVQAPRLLGPQPPTAVSRAEIPARTLLAPQPQTTLAEACVGELPPPTLLPLLHPSLDTTLRPPKMGFCTPSLSCPRNSSRTCSGCQRSRH